MSQPNRRGLGVRTLYGPELTSKSLGVGDPDGAGAVRVGKQNAVWAKVNLIGGGAPGTAREFDVGHDLGTVPVLCELKEWDNPTTPETYLSTARPVGKEKWTATSARVRILLIAGSFDGCVATFKVSGP